MVRAPYVAEYVELSIDSVWITGYNTLRPGADSL